MKLAEALQERADLNSKISELEDRIDNNLLVQEGEAPAEDPAELLSQLDAACERFAWLVAAINRTNSATLVNGQTLTGLIARKDSLYKQLHAYKMFVRTASGGARRARGTEIRILPQLQARELQQKVDQLSRTVRELDNLLQETNWTTTLVE